MKAEAVAPRKAAARPQSTAELAKLAYFAPPASTIRQRRGVTRAEFGDVVTLKPRSRINPSCKA
jgi:hypothetical protein